MGMDEEDGAAKGVGERKDARDTPPFIALYFFILFFLYIIITILTQNKLQYLVSEV